MKYWKHVKGESWMSRKSATERMEKLQKRNPEVQYAVRQYSDGSGYHIVRK